MSSQLDSIQVVDVLGDMRGKSQRMLAHQVLGALGVARLEGLDDVHVFADRQVDIVFLGDLSGTTDPSLVILSSIQPLSSTNGQLLRVFDWNR